MGKWRYSSNILDASTRWRGVVSFTLRPLYPRERTLCTFWIRDWVGLRAVLDAVESREIHCPGGNRTPAVQPVAHRYTF
jgi:hypothetical protein